MTLPNFLVIGAARAGTTSLYHSMGQHPQVFMSPIKEPNFFAYLGGSWDRDVLKTEPTSFPVRSLHEYQNLFRGVRGERAIGEVSPMYLAAGRGTAKCIGNYLPRVKLLAILRNPIERAYSHYLWHQAEFSEPRTFESAIQDERDGFAKGSRFWHCRYRYVENGFYCRLLKPFFEVFPRDQIAVFLFDDLQRDPIGLLGGVFHFLHVDANFSPKVSRRYNVSGIRKSRWIGWLLKKRPSTIRVRRLLPARARDGLDGLIEFVRGRQLEPPSPLSEEILHMLAHHYRTDVEELQQLIGRDLSTWLV